MSATSRGARVTGCAPLRRASGWRAFCWAASPRARCPCRRQREAARGSAAPTAPNGEIWHWLRLDHGQIASVFLCDPAWIRWPLLEAAMAGAQAEDLPLIMASFALSVSGVDL